MEKRKNIGKLRSRQAEVSFRKIKKLSPESLFLVSAGGMFEAYFEDALVFSKLMGIPVCNCGGYPKCNVGFFEHTAVRQALKENRTVAVIKPSESEKNDAIMIYSPGAKLCENVDCLMTA
ncbi:MAG TPA: hypothetical protein PKB02_11550 [Anaerohalosphaeraceae bacterium]|nr:hypothetical protein [Anaerohalosphaeraceae bacterium]